MSSEKLFIMIGFGSLNNKQFIKYLGFIEDAGCYNIGLSEHLRNHYSNNKSFLLPNQLILMCKYLYLHISNTCT